MKSVSLGKEEKKQREKVMKKRGKERRGAKCKRASLSKGGRVSFIRQGHVEALAVGAAFASVLLAR